MADWPAGKLMELTKRTPDSCIITLEPQAGTSPAASSLIFCSQCFQICPSKAKSIFIPVFCVCSAAPRLQFSRLSARKSNAHHSVSSPARHCVSSKSCMTRRAVHNAFQRSADTGCSWIWGGSDSCCSAAATAAMPGCCGKLEERRGDDRRRSDLKGPDFHCNPGPE